MAAEEREGRVVVKCESCGTELRTSFYDGRPGPPLRDYLPGDDSAHTKDRCNWWKVSQERDDWKRQALAAQNTIRQLRLNLNTFDSERQRESFARGNLAIDRADDSRRTVPWPERADCESNVHGPGMCGCRFPP